VADIQYLGHSCFRIRGRDGIVLCDPFDESVGFDIGKPTAHIVTMSHHHPGHSNVNAVRPVRDNVFIIDGPGEYEVRGILVMGVRTYHDKSNKRITATTDTHDTTNTSDDDTTTNDTNDTNTPQDYNTVYIIHIDDVVYCHLGDIGHELNKQQLEDIGNVDVLFVPVSGDVSEGATDAPGIISQIEPRMVIPMHYATPAHASERQLLSLDKFMHEMGQKEFVPQEKLSVSPSSLPPEDSETRIVVMASLAAAQ
jgi:L-ascorbate metabolism protein UlaG (beta-lactamase superfamily)